MQDFIDFITTQSTTATIVAAVIFVLSLLFLVKRLLSFLATLALVIIVFLSGLALVNHALFQETIENWSKGNWHLEETLQDLKGTFVKPKAQEPSN